MNVSEKAHKSFLQQEFPTTGIFSFGIVTYNYMH